MTRPELRDEIARLKAEVEQLKEGNECLGQMHEKEMARSAYLCEEVNRTKAEVERLEAEVQRLNEQIILGKAIVPDAEPVE